MLGLSQFLILSREKKIMLVQTLIRKIPAMLLLAVILIALPILAAAVDSTETGYRIVELSSPGAAKYYGGIKGQKATAKKGKRFDPSSKAYASYQKHLNNEQANFRAALGQHAAQAEVVNSFQITANAVVVKLNGLSPGQLKKISGAKIVHDVGLYRPTMDQSVGLINAPAAWVAVGGQEDAGEGVSVAVIDSGNPSAYIPNFHEFFDCKNVQPGGFFFSGQTGTPALGIKNENGNEPAPGAAWVSDHGSHVAGTVGGCITTLSGGVWDGTDLSGVAPGATLVDYNVFPGIGAGYVAFGGSAFSHDIGAAIEAAVAAGDDVINMSIGGGVQGPHDFLAEVSNAAVEAGVVVVTSAGNEGDGPYTVGSPGSAANVITVGASTNTRGMGILVFAPGFDPIRAFPGEFPDFDGSHQMLIDWPGSDNEACTSDVAGGSLSDEVVLIARGTCSFSQKVANAKAAGASGVIVYSDAARDPGGMAKTDGYDDNIPAVMISHADGLDLELALDGGAALYPTVITPPTIVPEVPNELAGFSSRGPAPFTGIVKPDVVAPGVNILSSVFSGYELFNGTSMASPHVAGAAAVLLQAHSDWTPAQVKSALATTATDLGLAPWAQGSGLINLEAALTPNAFFAPTNASFGTFNGKKPANGSVEISIETGATCEVDEVTGAAASFVDADVDGSELTVEFNGGRDAPTGMHGGMVKVDCGGEFHTIPWGAVVNRGD
jgi:minor extracellular serine protease Vpr